MEPARQILDWAIQARLLICWGQGRVYGSVMPTLDHAGDWYCPIIVYNTSNTFEVQFARLAP